MPTQSVRILCVDDEPLVLSSFKQIFSGHEVECFLEPGAAISHLLDPPLPSYDVIVCDVLMPDLSGVDVHKAVARRRPELLKRMIFLTGASMPGIDAFFVDSGCQSLGKPFKVESLVEAVRTASGIDPWSSRV